VGAEARNISGKSRNKRSKSMNQECKYESEAEKADVEGVGVET
jgi:hypothetical protein